MGNAVAYHETSAKMPRETKPESMTRPDQVFVQLPLEGNVDTLIPAMAAILQQYHDLVDRRLNGSLSGQDIQELHTIEQLLEAFEYVSTSEIERSIEKRHEMLLQQLRELTAELHKLRAEPKVQ